MKHICIDARMFRSAGIGTYIRNLLKVIGQSKKFSFSLLALKQDIDRDPELKGYELIEMSSPIYSLKEQIELSIKIPSCDLFWSPNFNVPLLPIRSKRRVLTLHDVFHLAHLSLLTPLQKMYAKTVIPRAVQTADLVITDSTFSKREIHSHTKAPLDKIHTIYLGVDQDSFSKKVEFPDIRDTYNLHSKFLLFVGNVKPHKNIQGLIHAYRQWALDKGQEYHLVIIGKSFKDFPLANEINQDCVLKRVVHFLHDVDNQELPWFYQNAKALLMPSFYEGFGLPPLEAMSAGCPVIVSNAASLPEICKDAALYINPHQPKTIVKALDDLLHSPEHIEDLVRKGKDHVKEFQWKIAAQKHIELFEKITT